MAEIASGVVLAVLDDVFVGCETFNARFRRR